jgi:pimeloyl-ACP methyl ester carboxylesterase
MDVPDTRYAHAADGDCIAYKVVGDGPFDLVYIPGFISHVELFWAEPAIARFYERLASFSRLILFDKRGTGLSDPIPGPQPLEERMEDVRVVMDAAGSGRAALVGLSEGSAMAAVFAATYPERTRALVLMGPIIGGAVEEHPAPEPWIDACRRFRSALEHRGVNWDSSSERAQALAWPASSSRCGWRSTSARSSRRSRCRRSS